MDAQAISPPPPVEVIFWACPQDETQQKVKFCEIHPEFSWIISADKANHISVWDYCRKECLQTRSLSSIVSCIDKSFSTVSGSVQPNSFVSARTYSKPSSTLSGYRQKQHLLRRNTQIAEEQYNPNLRLKDIGDIKRVAFIDRTAMQWHCGGISIPPTSGSFHTYNRIMIVCDGAILFYDFCSGHTVAISSSDLSKQTPCSAEFVYTDLCAVGCSDGTIRIWDCVNWKQVKVFTTTTRGEISVLKSLIPKTSPLGMGIPATGTSNSNGGLSPRESRMRLLSIAHDGSGLVWDSQITGNIIHQSDPVGHLLSQGSIAQHLDEISDTLYTVSSDRTIRLWDLSTVKKSATGTDAAVKPGRRASITTMSATSHAGSEHGRIPCVGKVKPGATLPPSLAKYCQLSALEHPRYPVGTFLVASKTNSIGIVQIHEASPEDQSESGDQSSNDVSLRLAALHDISLSHLMSVYSAEVAASSPPDPSEEWDIFSPKFVAGRDPTAKVYSVQPHFMKPDIVVVATSVGVVVLSLCPKRPDSGSPVGYHPTWGNMTLCYADRVIHLCKYNLTNSLRDSFTGGDSPIIQRQSTPRRLLQQQIGSRRSFSNSKPSTPRPVSTDDRSVNYQSSGTNVTVQLTTEEKIPVSADFASAGNPMGQANSLQTQKRPQSMKPMSLILATVTSQPLFYPSPTGKYCAVYWPESLYFVVYEILDPREPGVVKSSRLKEIDSGQCYSIGWVSVRKDSSNQRDVDNGCKYLDLCCIISPSKRLDATKRKKFGIFRKKSTTAEDCFPSMMLLRIYSNGKKVTETICSGAPKDVEELVGGGPLLCVTTLINMNDKATKEEKGAISKIELEAMHAQQGSDDKANLPSGLNSSAEIPTHMSYRSQFYYMASGSTSSKAATGGSESASASSGVAFNVDDISLVPVGPLMSRVTAVCWNSTPLKEFDSRVQYVAVLIQTRINILALSTSDEKEVGTGSIDLFPVTTVEVSTLPYKVPESMFWWGKVLLVSTPSEVSMVLGPCYWPNASSSIRSNWKSCVSSVETLCQLGPTGVDDSVTTKLNTRPYGCVEIFGVISDHVLVMSR